MIHHVFNSSLVSGPETLVIPNLKGFPHPITVVLLQETRLTDGSGRVADYVRSYGFKVQEIPVTGRFDLFAIKELRRYWETNTPSLIHAHGPKASLYSVWAGRSFQKKRTAKIITTHHGVRANDQSLKLRIFEKIYEKAVIPRCDLCLTVCTSDRELLIRRGIVPERLAVHLNGVDRKAVPASERVDAKRRIRQIWADEKVGNPSNFKNGFQNDFLIGVVGRLSPEKQHARILQALALLVKQNPSSNVRLLCFGSGPLESELKSLTTHLELDSHVVWMGYRSNISTEMSGLDIMLSLSSAEGLPINLIESGWCGVPVVAHAVDGVRDLIENGKSGVLLEPPATNEKIIESIMALKAKPSDASTLGEALFS